MLWLARIIGYCLSLVLLPVLGDRYRFADDQTQSGLDSMSLQASIFDGMSGAQPTEASSPDESYFSGISEEDICGSQPLDLVFIIDSSRSVRLHEFEKVKVFLANMIDTLDVRERSTHVAVVNYASTVKIEFDLQTYFDKVSMKEAVAHISPLSAGTMTGLAIQTAMEEIFAKEGGARDSSLDIPKVAIIVTDGRPQDQVEEVASRAHASGIEIYAVGVGRADMQSLRLLASEPVDEHISYVETYDLIEKLAFTFREAFCAVDACVHGNHDCEQICEANDRSWHCSCYEGYTLNLDERTCSRREPCAPGAHNCQQICMPTNGSWHCECYEGYILNADKRTCSARDSRGICTTGTHDCDQICVASTDSWHCSCYEGYSLNPDKRTCSAHSSLTDVCAPGTHDCQQICVPSGRSHRCECYEGFALNADKKTCSRMSARNPSSMTTEESCKCESFITFHKMATSYLETIFIKHILCLQSFHLLTSCYSFQRWWSAFECPSISFPMEGVGVGTTRTVSGANLARFC
uniref:Matrilin-3 isoform X2 n=1 Tax=Pogona vitticeps TaxID=103695 RepID=A0ABM5GPI9_9SAUR